VLRRPGVAAQDELAVEEERVRRAIDVVPSGGPLFGQHPASPGRPAQQLGRAEVVGDGDAGQADGLAQPVALDHERAAVPDLHDADHARVDTYGKEQREEEEEDWFHGVLRGARRRRIRRVAGRGLRWEREFSTLAVLAQGFGVAESQSLRVAESQSRRAAEPQRGRVAESQSRRVSEPHSRIAA
jgi:hypothetical protein